MNNHNRIICYVPAGQGRPEMPVKIFILKVMRAAARYYRWRLAFGIPS